LWTEIYADRWAYHLCDDINAAIAALIKTTTGISEVSAESYLKQADEIFAKASAISEGISHPEPYVRARALRLWAEKGELAHAEIERIIEGGLNLYHLDLLAQAHAAALTRHFLHLLLNPRWFQTETALAHAKRFFADFVLPSDVVTDAYLKSELDRSDSSLRDYFCYLMLDFATVDRDLADVALSASIVLARHLGIDKRFAELAQKELTIGKKVFARIEKDAEAILAKTETAAAL
jgi:hypothetical protein